MWLNVMNSPLGCQAGSKNVRTGTSRVGGQFGSELESIRAHPAAIVESARARRKDPMPDSRTRLLPSRSTVIHGSLVFSSGDSGPRDHQPRVHAILLIPTHRFAAGSCVCRDMCGAIPPCTYECPQTAVISRVVLLQTSLPKCQEGTLGRTCPQDSPLLI